jgi:hypothetical protein
MREIRTYGSEGGETQTNAPSLPLSRLTFVEKRTDARPVPSAPESAPYQESESLSRPLSRAVAKCNCVAVMQGGEQQGAKYQSVR